MLTNIPIELQRLPQWVCAGPNKQPLNPRTGHKADVTDRSTWGTFEEALHCGYKHIGFVLTEEDPYSIIDLDDPTTTKDAQGNTVQDPDSEAVKQRIQRHAKIVEAFESYTELSQSGKGLHIIVRGKVPKGCRRDKVELYSASRYMICTGNTYKHSPIADYSELLQTLFKEMTKERSEVVDLVQVDSSIPDEDVFEMGKNAVNGDKFMNLWNGEWQGNPLYPSQSEADFALLAMLCFYTRDNEQVRRLFRYSALGKRTKATKNNTYLNFALSKIRAKESPLVSFETLLEHTKQALGNKDILGEPLTRFQSHLSSQEQTHAAQALKTAQKSQNGEPEKLESSQTLSSAKKEDLRSLESSQQLSSSQKEQKEDFGETEKPRKPSAPKKRSPSHQETPHPSPTPPNRPKTGPKEKESPRAASNHLNTTESSQESLQQLSTSPANDIEYPPGFVGELAEYIYKSAIRPVPEIGLATAIALTAGVVGRAYNISGTGLNQYLIILAKTGSGKEGAATGIDSMISAVRSQVPMADEFIGPSAFASGQALIRVLDKQPCFVSVLGEVGLTLQQICDPKANSAQVVLKKVLLDIYNKSGFSKILRSSVYSDTEKNTKVIQAPNVTILGESTPETFYTGLDAANIAEGLVPRFSIFEYTGPRPARNPLAFTPPEPALVNRFAELIAVAMASTQNRTHIPVSVELEAQKLFDLFDKHADDQINSASQDVVLQLWNRAHLKALKMAALIAVGCNPHQPTIDQACADWAVRLVCRDIHKLLERFEAGEVGDGDLRMEADTKRAITMFLQANNHTRLQYKTPVKLLDQPLVPYHFLRRRLRLLASFKNDRRGANAALDATLAEMVKAGVLVQVPAIQAREKFDINSPIYGVGPNWNT